MFGSLHESFGFLVLWGLIATVAMTTILEGSQGLGLSRLSLPFLCGAFFTEDRRQALAAGFAVYTLGGWLFAFFYYALFASIGVFTWWIGALAGLAHGLFLLVCVLPLLPFVHPRIASEYHGASELRRIEPPGFLAVNYGMRTPLVTLLGQAIYGATLGGFLQLHGAMT